jgi:hypothetical protein
VSVRGSIALDGAPAPVEFRGVYTLEMGAPMIASAAAAAPLAAILQGGFEQLRPRSIRVELDGWDARRQLAIDNVWTSRREVRPGEAVEVFAQFAGDDGQEMVRAVRYLVPVGAPAGTLHFSVGDATSANLNEYRHFLSAPPRTAAQLVAFLNGLRTNSSAWVRVWRALPSYTVSGETLQAPPPSLALMLGRSMAPQFGARVAELEMPTGDFAVTGAKTIQVEVKE